MEILIFGSLLVALMVYVSTRIKKSAARAYEREIIETAEFTIIKPEGLIIPVNENSESVFEAYSKEYGDDETHNVRRLSADLSVWSESKFNDVCREAVEFFDKITSEKVFDEEPENQEISLFEGEKTANEIPLYVFRKIAGIKGRDEIYDLKISVLPEYKDQYRDKIKEILDGFSLK